MYFSINLLAKDLNDSPFSAVSSHKSLITAITLSNISSSVIISLSIRSSPLNLGTPTPSLTPALQQSNSLLQSKSRIRE
uniref:Uncharacterized protein n=1 Tax=uncultured marine virus TaxID=186617 RepID=A0A0F7L5H6_9VIRU|nr:hypothetical protein [uncultured marine virus]